MYIKVLIIFILFVSIYCITSSLSYLRFNLRNYFSGFPLILSVLYTASLLLSFDTVELYNLVLLTLLNFLLFVFSLFFKTYKLEFHVLFVVFASLYVYFSNEILLLFEEANTYTILSLHTFITIFALIAIKRTNSLKHILYPLLIIINLTSISTFIIGDQTVYITSYSLIAAAHLIYSYIFGIYPLTKIISKFKTYESRIQQLNHKIDIEVRKRTKEIEQSNEHLLNITKIDKLSKLLNKQTIFSMMESIIDKSEPFSILLYDIDKFKEINDTYGHVAGDLCIKRIGVITSQCIRDIDYAGRFGGDEFIIILPDTDSAQAMYIAERLRKKVSESGEPPLTVSIGIASYPADCDTLKNLLDFADQGLYISKEKGRNAVSHKNLF